MTFWPNTDATITAAHAQYFFHTRVNSNPRSAIRIPEIYHIWQEPSLVFKAIFPICMMRDIVFRTESFSLHLKPSVQSLRYILHDLAVLIVMAKGLILVD